MFRPKKTVRAGSPDSTSFWSRHLAWALLCICLIPISLILALHVPAVQRYLLQEAVRKLETNTDVRIQLESFRWSPFRELRLFQLKVKTSGENILECEEAKLGYHLSWRWPYLYPEELLLEKPWLRLERDAQGQWQIPGGKTQATETAGESKRFPWSSFPWPKVRIASGNIVAYQDGQAVLSIRDVNATLSAQEVAGSDGPKLKIDLGQWQGCVEIPELGEWELTGDAEITNQTFLAGHVDLNISNLAHVSGQGGWNLAPPFDGALEIQIVQLSTAVFPALRKSLPQMEEITGSLSLSRQPGIWSFDHDLKSGLGSFQGTLRFQPNSDNGGSFQLLSRFKDLNVPVPGKTPESRLSGQVEVTMEGTRLQTAKGSLHALLGSSRWGDHTIHKGEMTGTYEQGMLEIKTSKIQSSSGNFDLSANADLRGLWDPHHKGDVKFDLRADQAGLEKVFSGSAQRFGGRIVYDGHYGGGDFARWERWQGKMEANLSLPQLLALKASGGQKNDSLTLDYELEIDDLQKFAALHPSWSSKGKVTSRGTIKGTWPDLVWEGVISSPLVQVGSVQGEQASLKGKGRVIGKEGQRELSLKIQNLNANGMKLGSLNLDLRQEGEICQFNITSAGAWNQGSASVSGRLEQIWGPSRKLSVNQSTLSWKNQTASLDGRIELGSDWLRVQSLNLQQGKQKAQLTGEVWFAAKTDMKLAFDGIDLGQWSQGFALDEQVSGIASGQIQLSGQTNRPEASINLQLNHGTIVAPRRAGEAAKPAAIQTQEMMHESVIDRLQLQGTLARDVLSIQGDLQSPSTQNPVRFSAKIPMSLSLIPPRLAIKATEEWTASAKIAGLQAESALPYLTFLEKLGGRIDLDVQGSGTMSQPQLAGSGSWQNGSLKIKKWPHPIENIQLEWQVDSKQITIQKGTMEVLGGHLELKGRASYSRFQEMDLEVNGTDLEAKDIYGTKGKVSGSARLIVTPTSSKLTGILNLAKGEMNLGELETDLARSIRVIDGDGKADAVEVRKESSERNSFLDRLEMDLTINLPPSGTWVSGMGLEAEITGSLKIVKHPFAEVKLRGGFQTLRGEYKFQDYKLNIVAGELIFPEAPRPEPQLKIVCQKDLKDAIIQAHVTGPLKQPKLVLSSIPSMNQVDILSYLLFDQPAGDLSSKENSQLQDRAASWLGSQTSVLLKRVLGDTPFAPDTLEYRRSATVSRSIGTTGNRTDATVVAIGKHLTPDLYVNFEKGVTGEEGNQVAVEYRMNRNLSVQTNFGGTNQSGIDFFWRYDFGK